MEIVSGHESYSDVVARPTRIKSFPINKVAIKMALYIVISVGISMLALLSFLSYARASGIILENGCDGPGVPFGMLSGILFALFLRFDSGITN